MGTIEARALGAGTTVTISGREFQLQPLTLRTLQELQQEALASYKRDTLRSWKENAEALGLPDMGAALAAKLDEVSRWSISDLPKKPSWSLGKADPTEKAFSWAKERFGIEPDTPEAARMLAESALDGGLLTAKEAAGMFSDPPIMALIAYDGWWVTGCYEGICAMVHAALGRNGVTRAEVASWPLADLMRAAKTVESLTAPQMGNS